MEQESTLLAIELGRVRVLSANSLGELIWFVLGLAVLMGLTLVMIRWNNRARPDPFL